METEKILSSAIRLKSSDDKTRSDRCIFCRKPATQTQRLSSGDYGRKRVREIAEEHDDFTIKRRLSEIGSDGIFHYHRTTCYRHYGSPDKDTTQEPTGTAHYERPTRIRHTPRPQPVASRSGDPQVCFLCDSTRVWNKITKQRVFMKYRLSEPTKAEQLLNAMATKKDTIYQKLSGLTSVEKLFSADLFCHTLCFKRYTTLKQSEKLSMKRESDKKYNALTQVLKTLEPYLKEGYGFTISTIKEMMYLEDQSLTIIYNLYVKKKISDHYSDILKVCNSERPHETDIIFSSDISVADTARYVNNQNVLQTAGTLLRESLKSVDFGLDDKFCDGSELKKSWENTHMPEPVLEFFSALFQIDKSRMLTIKMLDFTHNEDNDSQCDEQEEAPDENDTDKDIGWAMVNQHSRLNCLFQIIYFQMFHGKRKTPLTTSFGQHQYGKSRSKEVLTAANRVGVSASYNEVRRLRKRLVQYTISKSGEGAVPIPATFTKDSFTYGALDNLDFKDNSSLSGTKSDHVTMLVAYQEARVPSESKPSVSTMNLGDITTRLPDTLPCQEVPYKPKPTSKPQLPPSFTLVGDNYDSNVDMHGAITKADVREAALSLIRCGYPLDSEADACLPTWGGSHALVSKATVPLSRVGFLPVIPKPVTQYATVYKALQNFQSVRLQLNPSQTAIPVVCDEGVYHIVMDILMNEPDAFNDVHAMMGMFHFTKVILRCAGRYLRGSGIEDAFIENDIFGKLTLNAVMEGRHYARSITGMIMVSDLISSLMWEAFWDKKEQNGEVITEQLRTSMREVQRTLMDKQSCPGPFDLLCDGLSTLFREFDVFVEECCEKSELCGYLAVFQREYASLIKHAVSSDREGHFDLHLGIVRQALPIFAEHDCINYLRCGTFYFEASKSLEFKHPDVFRHLQAGFFVVQDKDAGMFNAVSGDMKLEQTSQRSSKGDGGIVGQTKSASYITEWQIVFHEIVAISNNFRAMIHDSTMSHLETHVHHELSGSKGFHLHKHLKQLFDFIKDKGNPFVIIAPGIKLHNMVTKQMVHNLATTTRLLQVKANGERHLTLFMTERFLLRNKKISFPITKKQLPTMCLKEPDIKSKNFTTGKHVPGKAEAAAQRCIDTARDRGMPLEEIYAFDLFPSSVIFDGDFPAKPDKSALVAELENLLKPEEVVYGGGEASIVLDFMSKIRSFQDARDACDGTQSSATFGSLIKRALNAGVASCRKRNLHVVFDSYDEFSIKTSERLRRCGHDASVQLASMTASDTVPKQLDKFWNSPVNKVLLQDLARDIAKISFKHMEVFLSGTCTNDDTVEATCLSVADEHGNRTEIELGHLSLAVEEADDRLVLHCEHEVQSGGTSIVVISNDTDTLVRLLFCIEKWIQNGLKELWLEFGTGERRRHIPVHTLFMKLGSAKSRNLLKAHVLTGDDALSKIGTKHAAFSSSPELFLSDFAERKYLGEEESKKAETYLVKVFATARTTTKAHTFDELRLEQYLGTKTGKTIGSLPPSSSVIHGHLRRAFFVIRRFMSLLDDSHDKLAPTEYGWIIDADDHLLPDKCLKALPSNITVVCKCAGKCVSKQCPCKRENVRCVMFCHASSTTCSNKLHV